METSARATSVPKPMLPVYEAIISLTDAVCDEHLDSEYKALSRGMAAALCRKCESPLGSGLAAKSTTEQRVKFVPIADVSVSRIWAQLTV